MHGKYPYTEDTAQTKEHVSQEKGCTQAKPLLTAGIIGGLNEFLYDTFGRLNVNFTTRVCGCGDMLAE